MDAPKLKRDPQTILCAPGPVFFADPLMSPDIALLATPRRPSPIAPGKIPGDAPPESAAFAGAGRTPIRILAHMGDLFGRALHLADGRHEWRNATPLLWDQEVGRFLAALTLSICVPDTAITQGLATA